MVIACVDHDWGGASKTLEMAQKKKLPIINLADREVGISTVIHNK